VKAAYILAVSERDRALKELAEFYKHDTGSGYVVDPKTREYLRWVMRIPRHDRPLIVRYSGFNKRMLKDWETLETYRHGTQLKNYYKKYPYMVNDPVRVTGIFKNRSNIQKQIPDNIEKITTQPEIEQKLLLEEGAELSLAQQEAIRAKKQADSDAAKLVIEETYTIYNKDNEEPEPYIANRAEYLESAKRKEDDRMIRKLEEESKLKDSDSQTRVKVKQERIRSRYSIWRAKKLKAHYLINQLKQKKKRDEELARKAKKEEEKKLKAAKEVNQAEIENKSTKADTEPEKTETNSEILEKKAETQEKKPEIKKAEKKKRK